MSDDFTPVTGVEDDPAAAGGEDHEQEKSFGVAPGSEAAPEVRDFADLFPIPHLAAQVQEEIQQLLHMHRDIYDGVELATDQVQDKRIEFLEAGPEVTATEVFLEVAMGFFLESRLASQVIQRAFRFAGNAVQAGFIARRAAKVQRLIDASQRMRGQTADHAARLARLSKGIRELGEEMARKKNRSRRSELGNQQVALIRERVELEAELKRIADAQEALEGKPEELARKGAVTADALKRFFTDQEALVTDFTLAAVKANREARSATLFGHPGAHDTIGVQVKALAQDMLRKMELYLGLAAADAHFLVGVAASNPELSSECSRLLSLMLAGLRRDEEADKPQVDDTRRTVMLAVEKLLWAFLLVKGFPGAYPPIVLPSADQRRLTGLSSTTIPFGTEFLNTPDPPPARMMAYIRERFFASEKDLSDPEVFMKMTEHKRAFDAAASGQELLDVLPPLQPKKESNDEG